MNPRPSVPSRREEHVLADAKPTQSWFDTKWRRSEVNGSPSSRNGDSATRSVFVPCKCIRNRHRQGGRCQGYVSVRTWHRPGLLPGCERFGGRDVAWKQLYLTED